MTEELITEDATSHVQTRQSGVKCRLAKLSLGASCDYGDGDCGRLDKNDKYDSVRSSVRDDSVRSTVERSPSCVGGLGEKHNGKWKQLITLEMKSGISEVPTVSKKNYRFEQEAAGGVPDDSALERPMSFFLRPDRPVRKPSTFLQQFQELTNNDRPSAGTSDPPPPLPDCKPKWQGAAPCLPAIMSEKIQYKKKKKVEQEDDFEGCGEPEPVEVKRILERPVSAKIPRYPAHWDKPPFKRPPGRGGQGYCHGDIWKKPERLALSDPSCDGMPILCICSVTNNHSPLTSSTRL